MQADANAHCQLSTGMSAIDLVVTYMDLQQAFSDKLNTDALAIYEANANLPGNPGGSAEVASATEQRSVDSTEADRRTGQIDNIVQGQKSMAQMLGNSMSEVFELQDPINELMQATSDVLQQMLA